MIRLVHLTDLHFGLHRDDLVGALRAAIRACRPDAVACSGDLTQRALAGQFRRAMAFLHGLETPFLTVPGNHDLPLWNPVARLIRPFGAYRTGAAHDLAPTLAVDRLRLFGANTADPWQWRGGVARPDEMNHILRAIENGPPDVTNIMVCHHPVEEPPGFQRGETRGARAAMDRLGEAGLQIVLTGHLHHWTVGLGISEGAQRRILQVQTGTALCARTGERDHGFAVLDIESDLVTVTPWILDPAQQDFRPRPTARFLRRDGLWHAAGLRAPE